MYIYFFPVKQHRKDTLEVNESSPGFRALGGNTGKETSLTVAVGGSRSCHIYHCFLFTALVLPVFLFFGSFSAVSCLN